MADDLKKEPDTAASLINDWRKLLTHAVEGTEHFTKDKPLVALGLSFTAGMIFNEVMSALFRRRR
jgi:hypothetical protein